MSTPLRVLVLEDNPSDAELLVHELRRAGFEPDWKWVDSEADYLAHLAPGLDLILSAYSLPQWDATRALGLLQQSGLDIPFIVVTGSLGDEAAAGIIKRGAADYLLKDRIARLGPAVTAALEQKRLREQNQQADQALRDCESRSLAILQAVPDLMVRVREDGTIFDYVGSGTEPSLPVEQFVGKKIREIFSPKLAGIWEDNLSQTLRSRDIRAFEYEILVQGVPRHREARMGFVNANEALVIIRDITESKKAEEALRSSEERFRSVVQASLDAIILADSSGTITGWNPAAQKLFGYGEREVLGKPLTLLMPERHQDGHRRGLERFLATAKPSVVGKTLELEGLRKDGDEVPVELSVAAWSAGGERSFVGTIRDITERKHIEQTLRESEEKFRAIAESASCCIAIHQGGKLRYVNPALAELTGYTQEELLSIDYMALVHPDFRERLIRRMEARRTGQPVPPRYDLEILTKNGEERWIEVSGTSMQFEGEPAAIGTMFDITERKRAEELQEELRAIGEIARLVSSSLDIGQVYEQFAREVRKLVPFDRLSLVIVDQEQGTWHVALTFGEPSTFAVGEPHPLEGSALEYTIKHGDTVVSEDMSRDHRSWTFANFAEAGYRSFVQAVLRAKEEVHGAVSLFQREPGAFGHREVRLLESLVSQIAPAVENAQLFQRLKKTQEQLNLALSGAQLSTWDWDLQTDRIERTNAQAMYGEGAEDLGSSYEDFLSTVHPDDREAVKKALSEFIDRLSDVETEFRAVLPDGSIRWMLAKGKVAADEEGRPARMRGINLDITERKALQEELVQAQKMEVVGQLAGGVAHDFNNLLTPILGYAQLGADQLPPEHPVRDYLREMQEAAERGAALTRQLLLFSRRQDVKPSVVDLNDLVLNMEKLLRRLIGENIELVYLPGPGPSTVLVDPGQMEQVVVNMAINARDAMPDGGKLTIKTASVTLDARSARRFGGLAPGRYVKLSVIDTGLGMDKEVKSHLFEPFFTTKEPGKGTGLGLATCYGIVKERKGYIGVQSQPGRGATFEIYLPCVDDEAAGEAEEGGPDTLAVGEETVLLVEDEPSVRRLATEGLRQQGYLVLEAANGEEALRVAEEHGEEPIDLLVTDVVMPRMGGKELAQKLQARRPKIKVLFTSGFPGEQLVGADADISFLPKPFTASSLALKVRELLDSDPPAKA